MKDSFIRVTKENLKKEIQSLVKFTIGRDNTLMVECKICGCGYWQSLNTINEHFNLLTTNKITHINLYNYVCGKQYDEEVVRAHLGDRYDQNEWDSEHKRWKI